MLDFVVTVVHCHRVVALVVLAYVAIEIVTCCNDCKASTPVVALQCPHHLFSIAQSSNSPAKRLR